MTAPGEEGDAGEPRQAHPSPIAPIGRLDVDVTVSIVTWNSAKEIARCLSALADAAGSLSFHVTVVDNVSSDGSPDLVARQFPQVELIRNDGNSGFGAGHNRAIAQGVGRAHLVLNPDCFCAPGSLERLFQFLNQNPRAGLVGPKVLTASGELYPSCRSFPTAGALLFRNRLLSSLFPENPYTRSYLQGDRDHSRAMETDWLSAAALMVRREALQEIGPFDARFFMYCEDMDWSRRAHDKSWEVWYEPAAAVTHLQARSTDQRIPAMIVQHHRSMWKYYLKHEGRGKPPWWTAALALVLGARTTALVLWFWIRKLTGTLPQSVRSAGRKDGEG